MATNDAGGPAVGSPESHWGTSDPAAEPAREAVLGVRRAIQETKNRLGPSATADIVWAELQARGMKLERSEVERCFADPYRAGGV